MNGKLTYSTLFLLISVVSCVPRTSYQPAPPYPIAPAAAASVRIARELTVPPLQTVPLKGDSSVTIIIDPGHGGEDFGTCSNTKPVYQEKFLNLAASKILRGFLRQIGYNTLMTRTEDIFIPLEKRAEFANTNNPTLFVSVHFNSAPSPEAEGIEIFYYRSDSDADRTKASKHLAKAILDKILSQTQAKSRGVKHGNFAVIRLTTMPAVLVEGGFLTNDEEMEKIKDPAYLKKLMWGIAQGVHAFVRSSHLPNRLKDLGSK